MMLIDSILSLQRPYIGHNVQDISLRDTFNRRHVAEFPMMRTNAVLCCNHKGHIPMVIWFVDFVDQWGRYTFLTLCIHTVTGRTDSIICA